ncbi:heavy-metal-associated domain-containing protein [Ignatzschineria sp. LJL83]
MPTITLNIPEISCGHCTSSIESALKELSGIQSVTTSIENKTAIVEFAEDQISLETIIEAIDDIGFTATAE